MELDIAGLDTAGRDELLEHWRCLIGRPPPKHISRSLLIQILAFELQSKQHGGFSKRLSQRLTRAGLRDVIRLREDPLPLSHNDLKVDTARSELIKANLNELVALIASLRSGRKNECRAYLSKKHWVADAEFKRILSYLPGPPEEESLKELFEEVAVEWNYEKNFPLRPEMFHPKSGRKVWWRCKDQHEWEATIDKRSGAGRGCPYCTNKKVGYGNSLAELFPDLAKEWFTEGNVNITPFEVASGSGKRVWWKCENGHIFEAKVADRTRRGSKCKHCPGPGRGRKYSPPPSF